MATNILEVLLAKKKRLVLSEKESKASKLYTVDFIETIISWCGVHVLMLILPSLLPTNQIKVHCVYAYLCVKTKQKQMHLET